MMVCPSCRCELVCLRCNTMIQTPVTETSSGKPHALQTQEGGDHYKDMPIQPVEFIHKNAIPFIEGCIIKYLSRWRRKNGVEDLRKAQHFLKILIEFEEQSPTT